MPEFDSVPSHPRQALLLHSSHRNDIDAVAGQPFASEGHEQVQDALQSFGFGVHVQQETFARQGSIEETIKSFCCAAVLRMREPCVSRQVSTMTCCPELSLTAVGCV